MLCFVVVFSFNEKVALEKKWYEELWWSRTEIALRSGGSKQTRCVQQKEQSQRRSY